jgi:hypothetical protein
LHGEQANTVPNHLVEQARARWMGGMCNAFTT